MATAQDLLAQLVREVGYDKAVSLITGTPGVSETADRIVEWIGEGRAEQALRAFDPKVCVFQCWDVDYTAFDNKYSIVVLLRNAPALTPESLASLTAAIAIKRGYKPEDIGVTGISRLGDGIIHG